MSNMYAISKNTLTALGDAVRNKTQKYISTVEQTEPFYIGEFITSEMELEKEVYSQNYLIKTLKLKELLGDMYDYTKYLYYESEYNADSAGVVRNFGIILNSNGVMASFVSSDSPNKVENKSGTITFSAELDNITVRAVMWNTTTESAKVKLKLWACDADKKYIKLNGYTPLEMVEAINGLDTIPTEALNITGHCNYRFANGGYDWLINQYGEKITTKDINSMDYMFSGCNAEIIPFEINGYSGQVNVSYCFNNSKIKQLPKINIPKIGALTCMFTSAYYLREIPDDKWNVGTYSGHTGAYDSHTSIFSNCYSLRYITPKLLSNIWNVATGYYYSFYYGSFNYCYVIDEIVNLPVASVEYTSNAFSNTFNHCDRIKNMIFETNEDSTAKTAKWKNQIIDLSNYAGYVYDSSYTLNYNSGITADKEVKDDATYQALKNDPDWFTKKLDYCRYNHDSAVNTINSLPDTSAYGTNTIKFKGAAGAKTDGGAINTLTEEEIAVAAAKGWTVTLV